MFGAIAGGKGFGDLGRLGGKRALADVEAGWCIAVHSGIQTIPAQL